SAEITCTSASRACHSATSAAGQYNSGASGARGGTGATTGAGGAGGVGGTGGICAITDAGITSTAAVNTHVLIVVMVFIGLPHSQSQWPVAVSGLRRSPHAP